MFSIRAKAVFPDASAIVNRKLIIPVQMGLQSEQNRSAWRLIWGATLTGATWATNPTSECAVSVDTAATVVTGGYQVGPRFFCPANESINIDLTQYFRRNGRKIRGPGGVASDDILTVMAISENAQADVRGSIAWREIL